MNANMPSNPLDTLDNPQLASPEYYGQIKMDSWFCVLQKGVGKVDFDPALHALDQRRTAVKIGLVPLSEHKAQYEIFRDHIVESKEWAGIVLPSIKSLGISAKELQDKWVRLTFQPVGRTYTKIDPNTGETVTRDATTFKFLALYPNEEACRAAYHAERGQGQEPAQVQAQTVTQTAQAAQNGTNGNGANGNGNGSKERETALKFVKALVTQTAGNRDELAKRIAAMPMLAKHFTVDSPEVFELMAEYEFAKMGA